MNSQLNFYPTPELKNPDTEAVCQRIAKVYAKDKAAAEVELTSWIESQNPQPVFWEVLAIASRIEDLSKVITDEK
jgi:hypothetical protein